MCSPCSALQARGAFPICSKLSQELSDAEQIQEFVKIHVSLYEIIRLSRISAAYTLRK